MAYERCVICKEWGFFDAPAMLVHRCKPLWYARPMDDTDGDEWMPVYANDAEQAAAKWLEKHGPEGECCVSVVVRDALGDKLARFEVYAEFVLDYTAREEVLSDEDRARLMGDDDEPEPTNAAEDRYNRGGW